MSEKIGFVGVGRMGANMARRLKECGYPIAAVYDVNTAAAQTLAQELGCVAADQLKAVTALSDVIVTVVTDDKAMKKIFAGGLLSRAKGKLFINCATITPARQGTLYLMIGGKQEVFDRAKPLLEKLSDEGKLLRYIGPAGKAAEVKALVNMVMNINTAGLAEGLGLGAELGLDLTMLREVFSQTGANSRVLQTDGEDMQNREHSCFFSAAHAAKDSAIALKLSKQSGLNLPLAAATRKQYDRMVKEGLGDLDKSGIAELTFTGRHQK